MGVLSRLWFAMRTRNIEDAGTDDSIILIINEDGVEKLNFTFPDTSQDDQERGKANLYGIGGFGIRTENLTDSSIKVAIKGKDFWFPEHVLIWGEEADNRIVPLAAEWDIEAGISKDPKEGSSSFTVRRVGYPMSPAAPVPDSKARVRQILVVLTTANVNDAGTGQQPSIEITYAGGRKHEEEIRTFRMNELKKGQAFFSLPDTEVPALPSSPVPRWNNLDSIVLKAGGDDAWLPSSFFVFGFTTPYVDPHPKLHYKEPKPSFIMPLVSIPNWNLGTLSTDLDEGKPSISLPLLPIPTFQPGPIDPLDIARP